MKYKWIKISILALMVGFGLYIILALIPFMGRVGVSGATSHAYSIDSFYGQQQTPERVMLLEDPRESFFHRVNLISQAQEQIILATFAFNGSTSGDIIIGGLLSAAERGVDVTVIHNAIGGAMPARYINILAAHDNIDIYSFNRFHLLRPQFANPALHDKYMIIDNTLMIMGGRNIGDRYFKPDGHTGRLTYDREVLVYNTDPQFNGSIAEVAAYARSKTSSPRTTMYNRTRRSNWDTQINRYINLYLQHRVGFESFDYYNHSVGANRITLVTNPIESVKSDSVIAYNLMRLAQNSSTVVAQSPYVVFTNRNFKLFTDIITGTDFTLSTNSIASTTNIPSFSSYLRRRRSLVEAGAVLYEFQSSQESLHSKTFLFDGRLTAIGSFNLNERSLRSDTESMLIIDSEEFHEIVLEAVNNQIARSLRVNASGGYYLSRDVERAHASFGKRFLYNAAGYLLRPFWLIF
ncbi:MAG: phospholipase D-like domain-containing protein [Defluviitaleaceae bacterium]|nr:phospholipase D-like domain-containing protein [Defluviitaleaceae bacterium]